MTQDIPSSSLLKGARVLVTGGTGALGIGLVHQLVDAGCSPRVLARKRPPLTDIPEGVEFIAADIGDRERVRDAVRGARFVFHLAARLHIPNPRPEQFAEYRRINVEGSRVVVEECQAAGVERLIYFSTISVYGPTHGLDADEETPPHPETVYGETKLAGEEIALSARGQEGKNQLGVVLRMAAIYGPRMKGNYPRLVKAISRGMFVPVGNGSNRRTLVHEQDAIRAALVAASQKSAAGRIYNVSDGKIHRLREIIASISAAIGTKPHHLYVPVRPARWMSKCADGLMGLTGRSLNLSAQIDKFTEDVAIRAERIQRELSFKPQWDLAEGWQQAISAWQDEARLAKPGGR